MDTLKSDSLLLPQNTPVVDRSGILTAIWDKYFQNVFRALSPLGMEKSAELQNNVTVAEKISGMQFDKDKVNFVEISYFIQRVSNGVGASELVESGTLHLIWKPRSKNWSIRKLAGSGPDNSGITFSMNDKGEVLYVSTNQSGTKSLSKITYRATTLAAKYSAGLVL